MHPTSPLLESKSTTRFIPDTAAALPAVPTARTRAQIDAWAKRAAAANGFGDAGEVAPVSLSAPAPAPSPKSVWQNVRHLVVGLLGRWLEYRRRRAEHEALARLDAMTLRDLGITRSEIGSFVAERNGSSAITRLRVIPRNHEVFETSRLRIKRVDPFL
jgi:uncharacterized protein YjiS (DUF1127 family)